MFQVLRSPTLASLIASGLVLGTAPFAAGAEGDAAPVPQTVEERLQSLDQQVKILTRKQELAAEEAAAKSKESGKVVANAKDGFGIVSADGSYKLRIWGYLQADSRSFINDDEIPLTNTFVVRRARIVAEGTIAGIFDYRIMPDFGSGTTVLQDAYLTANLDPRLKLTAGRYKVPVGLEFLQADTTLLFIERGLPSSLAPARDEGLQASGDLLGGKLAYQVGIFNGTTDGANRDTDTNDDKDGAARLYATPFKGGPDPLAGLSVGVGGTYGYDDGTVAAAAGGAQNLPQFRTSGQNIYFSYAAATVARGQHWRVSPQAYYAWGPFSALGEYIQSTQRVQNGAAAANIDNQAWQTAVGWVLTGESASYKGVVPATPFALGAPGWGAVELVARVGRLTVDNEAFEGGYASEVTSARSATILGAGINWHLNRNVKVQLNYERTAFVGGGAGSAADPGDREDENLIESRFQLVF